MKNLFYLFLLFLISLSSQCGQEKFEPGQPFQLKPGQEMLCRCKEMSVTFVALKEDSRCPKNVDCIWEGQAVVELAVKGKTTQALELTLRAGHAGLSAKELNGYRYRLIKVDPYPEQTGTIPQENYLIELRVEAI